MCRQPMSNREPEEIDDLLGLSAKHVRTNKRVSAAVDDRLEHADRLPRSTIREPVRCVAALHLHVESCLSSSVLREAGASQGRYGEDHARRALVVWLPGVAAQEIRCDDGTLMRRNRSEWKFARWKCDVTHRIDTVVRHALQVLIDLDSTAPVGPYIRAAELKPRCTRHSASAMYDKIEFIHQRFGSARLNAQTGQRSLDADDRYAEVNADAARRRMRHQPID